VKGSVIARNDSDEAIYVKYKKISMELKRYKLGEIGEIRMCKRILKEETNSVGGVPFFKIGTFGGQADVFITKEKFEEYKNAYSYPKKGDVLISAAGTIGRTVVFDGKDAYFQDSNIVWIENDESKVLNEYLFYCYKNIRWTTSVGSTILRLYNDDIRNTDIIVPPLSEQKKIASVLSALDDKIALNKKMNQKLEAMAKRLYDYWFVQYDFPDKNGHPYKTTGGPMTYNPTLKREIPTGWEVKTLADFAEYVKTTTKFDKAFNYVSTDNMMPQKQGLSGENLKPASGNVLCYEKDDILISNIRPYFKKIWYADQSGTCSTDVLCIRSLNSDNSYFVYKTLWQDDFFDYVMQGAKGSKMPRGDKTRIMNYPICIAKDNFDKLIKKFSTLVVPMQAVIQKNIKEISRLTKLRDKLLPLLMNGQVVVDDFKRGDN